MAEAVVEVLIGKLGAVLAKEAATYGASLLCKEASALKGLYGELRRAEGELEMMKAYLHDTEKFKDTSEATGIFVKKTRDLAFRIEDVIDEFMYKLEANKHGGFTSKVKKKIKHVKIWRRLALELRDINVELEDTAKRRGRYIGGSDHHERSTNQTSCFVREEDLVGIEDNVDKLTRWLVGDLEETNHKIATVWGMGGAGKTTLVDYVYKIVKMDFDIAAWITVSRSYNVEDLLKKIAREFGISVDARNMEMRNLVEIIQNHLEEDYQMKRRRLIMHWAAAGFIKEKDNKTLEEVAEGYLNELVNRSLLQVVKKNEFGRVKRCRMHDVVRHLALDKAVGV